MINLLFILISFPCVLPKFYFPSFCSLLSIFDFFLLCFFAHSSFPPFLPSFVPSIPPCALSSPFFPLLVGIKPVPYWFLPSIRTGSVPEPAPVLFGSRCAGSAVLTDPLCVQVEAQHVPRSGLQQHPGHAGHHDLWPEGHPDGHGDHQAGAADLPPVRWPPLTRPPPGTNVTFHIKNTRNVCQF